MTTRSAWVCLGLLASAAALAGCGDESGATYEEGPKATVSGTVMLDGKPMEDGVISFMTQATGYQKDLPVKGGKFEGEVEVGKKRVEIKAYRTEKIEGAGGYTPPTAPGQPAPTESKINYVDPEFNLNSKLEADVKEGGTRDLKFEVKSVAQ